MITEHDLKAAIAECQGKPNPDARTCIMLAAFYTIQREMFGGEKPEYSYAPAPSTTISLRSESEFANVVNGKEQEEVMPVMDELMETLSIIQPRLYNAVMDRLV